MATNTLMTADEFLLMPDGDQRHELIRGEVRSTSLARGEHGLTGMQIAVPLAAVVEQQDLGDVFMAGTGFRIARDPDTVRAPDVSFLRAERWNALERPQAFIEGAPDLAVEIVSPSDSAEEVNEKALSSLDAGVRLLWVVHSHGRTVTVYAPDRTARVLGNGDTLDGGDVVPGFRLLIQSIFAKGGMVYETEVKLQTTDLAAVRERLEALGARLKERVEDETDLQFGVKDDPEALAEKVLRLRIMGDGGMLTWKGPPEFERGIKNREELQTIVQDAAMMRQILDRLGYHVRLEYSKRREYWDLRGLTISLDELPFGSYVEVEGDGSLIEQAVSDLGLASAERIKDGYPQLAARWLGQE